LRVREILQPEEVNAMIRRLRDLRRNHPKDDYDCLNEQLGVEVFRRKASLMVLEDDEGIVSFNTIHIGKRKKNIWEPYCNWTLAYTTPVRRRQGLARLLAVAKQDTCAFLGCARVKSKVGTYLGLRLHWTLGHHVWGFCPTGEIQID
jgi:hypothetical protein